MLQIIHTAREMVDKLELFMRDDAMQGTIEETEDAPEGSGANITVDLGSKESHLSEPRKDSAIGDQVSRPHGLLT